MYGSYDLPFGKGKQYLTAANRLEDLIIGGYQVSTVLNWSGGLPSGLLQQHQQNVPGSAPNYPSASGKMKPASAASMLQLKSASSTISRFLARTLPFAHLPRQRVTSPTRSMLQPEPESFVNPGLDNIGNVGYNTYRGPGFFNDDFGITKAFTVWDHVVTKFRMDAFNVFNHINPGNPGSDIDRKATSPARDLAAILATWNSHFAFSSNSRRNCNLNTRGASAPLVLSPPTSIVEAWKRLRFTN